MLVIVECSKTLTIIIMAFDKFSIKQWVGAFKEDQWCFMRRGDRGKQQAKAPSRCKGEKPEPIRQGSHIIKEECFLRRNLLLPD